MASLIFNNNATTTLSGSINNTQTSISVTSSGLFPVISGGDYFYATMYEISGSTEINVEIIKVTAVSGTTWTIERGQDGTTARARSGVTVYIELRWTAASARLMLQKDNNLSDLSSAATARTNLGLGTMATQSASNVAITGGTISGVSFTTIDSTTTIADNIDSTKKVAFEVSGVTTGTTRTLTIPNNSGTIALISDLTAGYQPLDAELTAIAAISANGLIARTAAGTAAVRTIAVPASGLTITNPDGVSGNPTLALADDLAAVEALATTGFVRRTGTSTWSASALVDGDLPTALTGKTYNALNLTANATGFSVAGGTTSKTLTVQNSLTLAGTDGTTITMPSSSGTLALAGQTFYIGTTSVAINRASGALSLTGVSIDGSAGSATSATSATTATNIAGGLANQIGYQTGAGATGFIAAPSVANTYLQWNGSAFTWAAASSGSVTSVAVSSSDLSVTGSPITSSGTISLSLNTVPLTKGGTGATTKTAAFNALTPMTTVGDIEYHDGSNGVRLAGNTTTTKKFLRSAGNGTAATAPAWDTLVDGDIPSALWGKTYNGFELSNLATIGFLIVGGPVSGRTSLSVTNEITLASDGGTGASARVLNIGSGGTLGSAAFTSSTAYAPAAGSTSIATVGTITAGTWTGSAIGISYGGTGATNKAQAFTNLSPLTTRGDMMYHTGSTNFRLPGNTSTTKQFLTQTGDGTASNAPAWGAISDGDLPSALTGKTYNGLSLTANATGFQIAGGTTAKTLVVSNNLTLAGTDGATLNIGGGGTLGSAAYTNSSDYVSIAGANFTGNLGLGSASAGWAAGTKAIDWQYYGSIFNVASGNFYFGQNTYTDGANWKAKATGAASLYAQSLGAHYWYSAASVAGGSPQAMSQTLSLDANGNLGVSGSITASGGGISANGTNATITWQDRNTTTNYWSLYSTSNVARLWSGISGSAGDKLTVDASGNLTIAGTFSGGSLTNGSVTPAKLAQPLTQGTAVASTSGAEVGFTGIPGWVKRITIALSGVSIQSGGADIQVQLGTGSAPTYASSGYSGGRVYISDGFLSTNTVSSGLTVAATTGTQSVIQAVVSIVNVTGNKWVMSSNAYDTGSQFYAMNSNASIDLAAALTAVRVYAGGTAFDAGTINILYE